MASSPSPASFLAGIPEGLRTELLQAYNELLTNYRERRWEPSELNGGKLCEVVYTILHGHVDGAFPAKATKPQNMFAACLALEKAPQSFPRSVRIQIPRMLLTLYEIRNNRGVGHVGGDVSANEMDATAVVYMAKWVLAELVRLFHGVDTKAAETVVERIVERVLPVIWEVDGKYRVLDASRTMKEKVLLILYHCGGQAVPEQDLCEWVEHSNASTFRRDILRRAHEAKLLEYDAQTRTVRISPKGVSFVEQTLNVRLE